MTTGQTLAAALTAVYDRGFFPDLAAYVPETIRGEAATAVLMVDHDDQWVIAVHLNYGPENDWHVSGRLDEDRARRHAFTYAQEGLSP